GKRRTGREGTRSAPRGTARHEYLADRHGPRVRAPGAGRDGGEEGHQPPQLRVGLRELRRGVVERERLPHALDRDRVGAGPLEEPADRRRREVVDVVGWRVVEPVPTHEPRHGARRVGQGEGEQAARDEPGKGLTYEGERIREMLE